MRLDTALALALALLATNARHERLIEKAWRLKTRRSPRRTLVR